MPTQEEKQRLYNMYNATSSCTAPENDQLETYEDWLERQLLSRIKSLESLEGKKTVLRSQLDRFRKLAQDVIDNKFYLNHASLNRTYEKLLKETEHGK